MSASPLHFARLDGKPDEDEAGYAEVYPRGDGVAGRKTVLILGAGTAGTMAANHLRRRLSPIAWRIIIVDQNEEQLYQPGLLMLPFEGYAPEELVKPRAQFLALGVELVLGEVDRVEGARNQVRLRDGQLLSYDQLIIASGASTHPEETPGMLGPQWNTSIFEFYTLEGATRLRDTLKDWKGGRLVVHLSEMPIKCPVAPLEFAFLADAFFEGKGMREQVELVFVTPLDAAFTKPIAAEQLGRMLHERHIALETDFLVDHVNTRTKELISVDGREVPYGLLITVPVTRGAAFVSASGLGDELGYVPVSRLTLQSIHHSNSFALGDASNIPASKAGSVAHFSMESFTENFLQHVEGKAMTHPFDGHTNCFIESGHHQALMVDFNYDTEPLTGKYPVPGVGPFSLLTESRVNHLGKLGFRWMYWNVLLPGRPTPIPNLMSMHGKHAATAAPALTH